jgi:hypothetical protein
MYQCINLDNVVWCTSNYSVLSFKFNVLTLQAYSSCIEFVGVDIEWMLEWHI